MPLDVTIHLTYVVRSFHELRRQDALRQQVESELEMARSKIDAIVKKIENRKDSPVSIYVHPDTVIQIMLAKPGKLQRR